MPTAKNNIEIANDINAGKLPEANEDNGTSQSSSLWDTIKEGASNAWNKIKEGASNTWNSIKEAAQNSESDKATEQRSKEPWKTNAGYDTSQGIKQEWQGGGNTGQGAEAALGTNYSWEKQGTDKAVSQYGSDVLSVKQNAQENASTINQNLSQYQEQADMLQYQNNQQAEKVGWTGGYVLDQNRQMDYLKASLNAQMYGAIKLQEYGYDTSLAAARLSYDLNQKAYAQEYYTQAVTNALNEAQITGTYFSAETKDMMSQLSIAKQIAADSSQPQADKDNANKLIKAIEDWFSTNGISKEGVQTLQAWQADQQNELNWQNEIWSEYQAALQTAQAAIDENATAYLMYGNNNQIVYENGEVKTIDMSGLSSEQLSKYAKNSPKGQEQVQSYIDYLYEKAKTDNTKTTKDSNGNETSQINQSAYDKQKQEIDKMVDEINNGASVVDKINNGTSDNEGSSENLINKPEDKPGQYSTTPTGGPGKLAISNAGTNYELNINTSYPSYNVPTDKSLAYSDIRAAETYIQTSELPESWKTVLKNNGIIGNDKEMVLRIVPGKVAAVDDPGEASFDNDDICVRLFTSDPEKETKASSGWGLEVANNYGQLGGEIESMMTSWYKSVTDNVPSSGALMQIGNDVYFYNSNGEPYQNGHGWYKIGGQAGDGSHGAKRWQSFKKAIEQLYGY